MTSTILHINAVKDTAVLLFKRCHDAFDSIKDQVGFSIN